MLGDLDMMFHGPSVKDGLTLGAITEDPREDMVSDFTVSWREKRSVKNKIFCSRWRFSHDNSESAIL